MSLSKLGRGHVQTSVLHIAGCLFFFINFSNTTGLIFFQVLLMPSTSRNIQITPHNPYVYNYTSSLHKKYLKIRYQMAYIEAEKHKHPYQHLRQKWVRHTLCLLYCALRLSFALQIARLIPWLSMKPLGHNSAS